MAWTPGGMIAEAAGKVAGGIATPFANAFSDWKKSDASKHIADRQADRDMAISSFQTDQRFGELDATLSLADRKDKATSWIRPVGAGIALYVFACVAIEHSMPRLAKLLWIETSDLPMPWAYVCAGILIALFGLRPLEKWTRNNAVTTAQANIVQAQVKRPALKLLTGRADDR